MKILFANIIAADGTPRSAASHLGLLLEKVPQDLFHTVYFEYEENSTHCRLLSLNYAFCHTKRLIKTSDPVYTDQTVNRNQLNLSIFDTPRQIAVKSSKQSRSW